MASLYNMLRIICSPLAALVVVLLTTPAGVLAQIPSTTNAVQSSGNNSFGASTSPIGTPTYNTSPESINSLNQAVNETISASTSTLLKAIAEGSASDASLLASQLIDAGVSSSAANTLITSLQALIKAAKLATSSTDSISALQASITAFNAIITQSDSTVLSALETNNDVLAIRTVLISARDSYSATP